MKRTLTPFRAAIAGILAFTTFLSFGLMASGSSHREAPIISGDPKVDATDLYAFVSPDSPNTVTFIANYSPFEEPAGGPNFDSFDDKARYAINIDNNGDAMPDIVYEFKFNTQVANPNTFLYNTGPINSLGDSDWNVKQTYTLTKIEGGVSTVLGTDLKMPPVNIGPKSTPNYAELQAEAYNTLPGGGKVFAGQSDDPFFVDLGSLFDLLSIRKLPGNAGGGVNTTQGFNVHSIVLQVPIAEVTLNKNKPTTVSDPNAVIGVWTTASRQSARVLNENGTRSDSGAWVQVSRLGAPLVNEVVVPLGAKDLFNASKPQNDAQFANGVTDPELGKLFKAIYNIAVPPQGPFGSSTQRDDLTAIFLTGIPGLTAPANVVPSEQLRLNVAVAPTASPKNLGVLAGDNQGYPNGRRLADDVIDISLRAVAGAAYPLFHPEFTPDATGVQLGDGVDQNDLAFRSYFPYVALPHQGFASQPHGTQAMPGMPPVPPVGTTTPPMATTTPPTNPHGLGMISGTFYNDLNQNDRMDAGEHGIPGFKVKLYKGEMYWKKNLVAKAVTDANGMYSFSDLPPGTYAVVEVTRNKWYQYTGDYPSIEVKNGSNIMNINFSNFAR